MFIDKHVCWFYIAVNKSSSVHKVQTTQKIIEYRYYMLLRKTNPTRLIQQPLQIRPLKRHDHKQVIAIFVRLSICKNDFHDFAGEQVVLHGCQLAHDLDFFGYMCGLRLWV